MFGLEIGRMIARGCSGLGCPSDHDDDMEDVGDYIFLDIYLAILKTSSVAHPNLYCSELHIMTLQSPINKPSLGHGSTPDYPGSETG